MKIKASGTPKVSHGVAFSDYITTGDASRHLRETSFENEPAASSSTRMRGSILLVFFTIIFLLLFARLFLLQMFQGRYYRTLSDSNRIRTFAIHAPRGVIFDRNVKPLVYNVPGFRRVIGNKTQFLTRDAAIPLLSKGEKDLEVDALREYPYKDSFAHVLGFVGQVNKEELDDPLFQNYRVDDTIGKMGIEGQYEALLKGIDGKKLVEVNSVGKVVRTLGQVDPIAGHDVQLTEDQRLQEVSYKALSAVKKGTVIVSTPKGDILALVSRPSFDPNLFTLDKTYQVATDSAYTNVSEVLVDLQNQPFLNRAIAGEYPPGSTFKIVVAASGLDKKIIDQNYQVEDNGILRVGSFSFANWYYTEYGRTEGSVNVVTALKRSNDIFFYKLAEKVGVDTISEVAAKFGVGKRLGIDLPGEQNGLLPTSSWKKKTLGEQWYLGDTYHYGIGQGFLLTTPLQVNAWTQVIANGGSLYQPHLLYTKNPVVLNRDFLSQKTVALIRQGMQESCSPGGVAWPLFNFTVKNAKLHIDDKNILEAHIASASATPSAMLKDYRQVVVACKTGTAEHGSETTKPHAWITLFAPAFNPQIVVTVLAEESGEGSNIAAPIAKKILEEWFSR